jgi:hypothetical protein
MSKLRVVLMHKGRQDADIRVKMNKPILGEIISFNDNHYEVEFIQHVIDNYSNKLEYILVTGIKK